MSIGYLKRWQIKQASLARSLAALIQRSWFYFKSRLSKFKQAELWNTWIWRTSRVLSVKCYYCVIHTSILKTGFLYLRKALSSFFSILIRKIKLASKHTQTLNKHALMMVASKHLSFETSRFCCYIQISVLKQLIAKSETLRKLNWIPLRFFSFSKIAHVLFVCVLVLSFILSWSWI